MHFQATVPTQQQQTGRLLSACFLPFCPPFDKKMYKQKAKSQGDATLHLSCAFKVSADVTLRLHVLEICFDKTRRKDQAFCVCSGFSFFDVTM